LQASITLSRSHQIVEREADRRALHVGNDIDALLEPPPDDSDADVGLVLMVGDADIDRQPVLRGKLRHRLPDAHDRAGAAHVAVDPGLVVEHADADRRVALPTGGARTAGRERGEPAERGSSGQHRRISSRLRGTVAGAFGRRLFPGRTKRSRYRRQRQGSGELARFRTTRGSPHSARPAG